ncbi:30S ribosomal protein S1 [Enterobacterales bacterium endosymbiont of Anomoneura mori]|uniref:S1 RNA-binding domain-containing protein n=1 Tax=Enterobacterales bacterium endosymbiont of Anomoneura mori TaxID=3132096 RepID=UPI00399D4EE0
MIKSFNNFFKKVLKKLEIKSNLLYKGYIKSINKEFVTIDAGFKSESLIPIEEFKNKKGKIENKPGDIINVILENFDNGYGETILSREKAKNNEKWLFLKNILKNSISMFGYIQSKTKGGYSINLNNIKAFLPSSLIDIRPLRDIKHLENRKLEFKVIKIDKIRNNIVVSRKAAIIFRKNILKKKQLKIIKKGINVKGIIKNITDYGAFINVGGLDGLLHITDMSWKRINHPSDIVNIGDEVILKVIKFDSLNKRISLGLKQRFKDPWKNILKKYPKGSIIEGKISNLTNYGCFVKIEEGIEGLLHISEIKIKKKKKILNKLFKINKKIKVFILNIDKKKRRISLGMKQFKNNPWKNFFIENKKGDNINGIIKSVTDFGIFINLKNNINGLIHFSDISWNFNNKKILKKFINGKKIKVIILHIDYKHKHISLGIKQLKNNLFNIFLSIYKKNNFIIGKMVSKNKNFIKINLGNNLIGYLNILKFKNIIFNKNYLIKIYFLKINNKNIILSL